jgi:glycosyltransferase involved in cell wall biosynthesis
VPGNSRKNTGEIRMNILHISPYCPSLETNHAGGVCMGKEIETLRKWHNIYVLTFVASDFDRKLVERYKNDGCYKTISINRWTRIFHVLTEPFFPNFFAARSSFRFTFCLLYTIKKNRIDVVHAEYASMGQYFWLIRRAFPHVKICFVEHDVTIQSYERKAECTLGVRRLYYKWQCSRIKKAEGAYCRSADLVLTFNEKDKNLIRKYYKTEDVKVINPYYGLNEIKNNNSDHVVSEKGAICFLGQMGREENYEAAARLIHISEKVKKSVPQLQVYIVGNNPPRELIERQNEYIHVTGFVEDVDQYLMKCQLAVFPLTLGAGIKIKVLRSLALGVPVITGKVGAEGIDENGQVIVFAETDEEYGLAVVELLKDDKKRLNLSEKSRNLAFDKFDWQKSIEILNDIYRE